MRHSNVLAFVLLLSACGAPPAPPLPPPVCGGATLASVRLVAGGRAEITLSPALAAALTGVDVTSGLDAWREGDRVIVRAGYVETAGTLTATCETGALEVPILIEPLAMVPLLSWDASMPDAPSAREYFAAWMDPGGARSLYVYGGFVYEPVQFTPSTEAFRLDLTTLAWSRVTISGAAPPPGGRVAANEDGMFYFGGATALADGSLDTPAILREITGDGDALGFESAPFEPSATGSYTGAFVHDAARGRWLSICGAETRSLGIHCGVSAYTPEAGFTELEVEGDAPRGRYGFHYALDADSDRVIVFGGQTGSGPVDLSGDTWALELAPEDGGAPRWVQLFESAEGISPRRNGAFALDPGGHRFFVWGGTADGRTAVPGLDVLELDRGRERWVHVELPADVPPRASGGGVLDPSAHRILWGFGNEARLYTDLYALALAPSDGI